MFRSVPAHHFYLLMGLFPAFQCFSLASANRHLPDQLGADCPTGSGSNSTNSQNLFYLQKFKGAGFYTLQNLIDNIVLQTFQATGYIQAEVSSQQIKAYDYDNFVNVAQYNIDFFTLLPLVIVFTNLLYKLLIEKEKKIRFLSFYSYNFKGRA